MYSIHRVYREMAEVMEFVEVVVFIEFIEVVEVIEFIELMHTLEFIAEMRRENVQGNSRVHRILIVYIYDLSIYDLYIRWTLSQK